MQQNTSRATFWLFVPVLFLAVVGVMLGRYRAQQHRDWLAYYQQPWTPKLELVRGEVPGYTSSSLFEASANCMSIGGSGQSQWLIRAQLFDVSDTTPREIWNSQKLMPPERVSLVTSGSVSYSAHAPNVDQRRTSCMRTRDWRFMRHEKAEHLKLVVEAVAISMEVPEEKLGTSNMQVHEVTSAQLVAARQQPGAKYLRQSLILEARDDSKHTFSEAEMNANQ